MILDVVNFALLIDPFVGVRAVSVHVSVTIGGSTVREENSDLMKGVWCVSPEVPNHVGVAQVSLRVSLLAVNEVWELNRVLDEEDWSVVSNHIVVTLLSVELDGESSWISDGVG